MKIIYKMFAAVFLMLLVVQCDIANDDSLNNPNAIAPENVNPNFLLNSIQLNTRNVYSGVADIGREMTRMTYMFGTTYDNAYSSATFSTMYQNAYSGVFIDAENLAPLAEEQGLYFHLGMAKVLKAYTMITMVDVFGDMPLEEALDPTNFNPDLTDGEAIYDSALVLLDEAIADLQNEDRLALPDNDMYYGDHSDPESAWIRAANTIKLKAYLNTGNTAGINELVADDNLITDAADDFTFEYSTNDVNPDSRHPSFSSNYLNGALDYMAVNYMNMMINDKDDPDPRLNYYFYRQQTTAPLTIQENPCLGTSAPPWYNNNDPYCLFDPPYDGYWGRDHLNDEGIPTDTDKRTIWGIYPVGGEFDAAQGAQGSSTSGYQGAGFRPILMSSFTHFMLAEAALELGTNTLEGSADAEFEAGIRASLNTVADYGEDRVTALGAGGFAIEDADIDDYVAAAEDNWTNEGELRANSKEFYIALWPNGYEAYNMMRRTGYPDRSDNLQPTVDSNNPGEWYRTFTYPANMVDRNSSISQKTSNHVRTFWDTRGADDEFDF